MTEEFIKGVDVSMTLEVQELDGKYFLEGEERDLFEILVLKGINAVRLRVWVDPYDDKGKSYMGGTNDLARTILLGKRAKKAGMKLLLNLHYSDFWTDPKKQAKPKKWEDLNGNELEEAVYLYTYDVLEECRFNGLIPDWIQVGNEITNGMLWPEGKTPVYLSEKRKFEKVAPEKEEAAYDRLSNFLYAGIRAVREFTRGKKEKEIPVILHLDYGGANDLYRKWFDEIGKRNVDFDIIGLSYYPFWHGSLDELSVNMNDISERYDKEVMVVETAYGFTTEPIPHGGQAIFSEDIAEKGGYPLSIEGQGQFLRDLMKVVNDVPNGRGGGVFYWEPAWLPVKGTSWASKAGMEYGNDVAKGGNPWANLGLFDYDGNALKSLDVFGGG
ncbi:arabinogalactan endo-beta-1,4-galactanase [Salipaludibacillus sp. HK11]|uniref:glycoside hydrolase family 53 protein n=1 Tax=Salipaludibacillus sp. HK11 TaxID=3394320 RepID=UPI0039FCA16D